MKTSRNTIQRALVLQAVNALRTHPTADQVYEAVTKEHSNVSKATVYRNLKMLAEAGEIRQIELANEQDRYDFHTTPHYHFKCKDCGVFFDISLPTINVNQHIDGCIIESYELVFKGKCPNCQTKGGI